MSVLTRWPILCHFCWYQLSIRSITGLLSTSSILLTTSFSILTLLFESLLFLFRKLISNFVIIDLFVNIVHCLPSFLFSLLLLPALALRIQRSHYILLLHASHPIKTISQYHDTHPCKTSHLQIIQHQQPHSRTHPRILRFKNRNTKKSQLSTKKQLKHTHKHPQIESIGTVTKTIDTPQHQHPQTWHYLTKRIRR